MPIKGYTQSDSHKEKLSKIAKGRHFSEKTRIKLSKSHKGHIHKRIAEDYGYGRGSS